jgi:serine/threonine-protein kinase HipA
MMLKLAGSLGIQTPEQKIMNVTGNKPILLVKRFDRTATGERIPFMSAMTLLIRNETSENPGSYLEMVDALVRIATNPVDDARELWRRMVLNVLAGNIDDHLRNHGFLHTRSGWVLSPAYDLNPTDQPFERRNHVLTFDGRTNAPSLKLCLSLAPYFRYEEREAIQELERIRTSVANWKKIAQETGLEAKEIRRMEKGFSIL